jgi:hypothetical protein
MAISAQKILGWYDSGIIVAGECVDELCELATSTEPSAFVESIPPEFIGRIRERTDNLPRAEDVIILFGGTVAIRTEEDRKSWLERAEAKKVRYVEGLRNWKAYFESKIEETTGGRANEPDR